MVVLISIPIAFRSAYELLVGILRISRSGRRFFRCRLSRQFGSWYAFLMLRDKLGGANKESALVGVRGNVKQVLDIANFAKLLFKYPKNFRRARPLM